MAVDYCLANIACAMYAELWYCFSFTYQADFKEVLGAKCLLFRLSRLQLISRSNREAHRKPSVVNGWTFQVGELVKAVSSAWRDAPGQSHTALPPTAP